MMFGIVVRNTGMWGLTSWCRRDGKVELYETREEAQRVADQYNERQGPVNRFNYYYAQEYDGRYLA